MSQISEPVRPSFDESLRNPSAWRRYLADRATWEAAHPEVMAARQEAERKEQEQISAAQEAKRKEELPEWVAECLHEAGVPERLAEVARGNPKDTEAVFAVRAYMQEPAGILLLVGAPGVGKSVAAVSALAEHAKATQPESLAFGLHVCRAVFRRAAELARLGLYGAEAASEWDRVHRAALLIVDDLGAELLSDPWRAALDELVDVRYSERKATIITSNLDGEAFKARYGERIADRIRHDGRVVKCGNQSLRRVKP